MMNLFKLKSNKAPVPPPEKGVYHFKNKLEGSESRMHLRVEGDGSAFLMVNASRVYHFNPTAAYMAFLTLHDISAKRAVASISKYYNVPRKQAESDFSQISSQVNLITTPDYDRIAAQMRYFMALDENQIASLKLAVMQIDAPELEEMLRFNQPDEDEELIEIIPVLNSLPAAKKENLLQNLKNDSLKKQLQDLFSIKNFEVSQLSRTLQEEEDMLEPIWDTILPFSKTDLSAPYRMDLALSYRCNNNCSHCYNARPRSFQEMSTTAWKEVLDGLWEIGIPHIIFTGGEPTLREDLPELIAYAEQKGQITGINTNGRKLSDPAYVQALVDAGLDHVQITLESHDPAIHDEMVNLKGAWQETVAGIKNVLETRLYLMTNTTILQNNHGSIMKTLDFLAELGLQRVGLNALIYSGRGKDVGTGLKEDMLPALLEKAIQKTDEHNQKLTWYTPTQYCHFDPVLFDHAHLGVKGCTAALYNMCIEPDGSVLPCQSYYQSLGNFLSEPWENIWNHKLAVSLRERKLVKEECHSCSLLSICGGGCPLAQMHGQVSPPRHIPIIEA